MSYLKNFLIQFLAAFLLAIAGVFFVYILSNTVGLICQDIFGDLANSIRGEGAFFIATLVGIPLGASLGVFIAKKVFLRRHDFGVFCIITAFVSGVLANWFLALYFIDIVGATGATQIIVVLLIAIIASLTAYNLTELLLHKRR